LLAKLSNSIAIAIAILGAKSIAILTAILFAILHCLLPQINFDSCCRVQLFLNFGLTTDYVIVWSTQNLSDNQVTLTCYFSFSFFTQSNKRMKRFFA